MTCGHRLSDEAIGAFIDRELAGAERAAVAERLLADPESRGRHDADTRIKVALKEGLTRFDPGPADFAMEASVLAAARARPRRRVAWRTMCAAVALVGLGWVGHAGYQSWLDWQVPQLVEDAAQAHQVFAHDSMRPVETQNASTLETWFSAHLGEQITIPDLRPAGLHFMGGRLLSFEQGALAQIIYEDARGQRLSLYIAETDADESQEAMEIVRLEEVDAGYWRDGGVTYAVVAESSVEQVIAVASVIGITPDPVQFSR